MRPIFTDRIAWSVSLSVGRSVSLSQWSPAKTAEPIEIPFGLRTLVGPWNQVLDGVQIPPLEGAIFGMERGLPLLSIGTLYGHLRKIAEPIEMPFGFWARMGPRNHVLDGPGVHRC